MKKIIILFVVSVVAGFAAAGQNLDPTVEVSRTYEGELMDIHKPVMEMAVPDSVYRFDLDFDYSVFDNPYGGSYEFNPYRMDMKPENSRVVPSEFYLNAGAGYTLHPVLDVLYSPELKGDFSVGVFGKHRSYVGDYRNSHVGATPAGAYFKNGYDLLSEAGVDFGYDWAKAELNFGASYYGIAVKDAFKNSCYNAVDAYISANSKSLRPGGFMYDLRAAFRYGNEALMNEYLFDADVTLSHSLNLNHKVLVDLGVDFGVYGGALNSSYGRFYAVPRYMYERKRFRASVGMRISAVVSQSPIFKKANQYVYPDVHLSYDLLKDALRLYVDVKGGETLNTYASMIEKNHHIDFSHALDGSRLMGSSIERVRPEVGFEGRISGFFSYGLRGGYALYDNVAMDAVRLVGTGYRPVVAYGGYEQAYAQLDWSFLFDSFRCFGGAGYYHTWDIPELPGGAYLVMPPQVRAEIAAEYNWRKRIYVGLDCEYVSRSRTLSGDVYIPYYIDLGAYAEYVVNRKFSIWVRGGNLLDMEIQKIPLYAEKGINFTAGICLKF